MSAAAGSTTPIGGWSTVPSGLPTQMQTAVSTMAATPRIGTPRRLEFVNVSPSGLTPPAKRPLDRASIQVANTGERPLTHEELTAGFYALSRKLDIEEACVNDLRDSVVQNAVRHCSLLAFWHPSRLLNYRGRASRGRLLNYRGRASRSRTLNCWGRASRNSI